MTKQKCITYECTNIAICKSDKCKRHGGGKRCNEPGCTLAAIGKIDKCIGHGGGKRCNEPGCKVSAADNSDKCKRHGGGKRCPGCFDSCSGSPKYDWYCSSCFKYKKEQDNELFEILKLFL